MIKLLNLEIKINQKMNEIKRNCLEATKYFDWYETELEKDDVIYLLNEIPDILESLDELLTIYVESVEKEYAELYKK